jgi:hypothetical protein
MQNTLTVGELKSIIEGGNYSDDTPIVLDSYMTNGEAIALQLYPVETTIDGGAILLTSNPYESMGYEDL